jgi:hypothetical protein
MRRRGLAAAFAGAALLLVSCPNPFDLTLTRQAGDTSGPAIVVTAPISGSTFQSTVTVAGTVTDGTDGRVASLTLSVPVAEIDTPLTLGDGGAFSHSFSTAGISRAIVITLRAADWNGNTTELVVTLFNDDAGPGIAIESPDDTSTYLSSVELRGRVQNMVELDELTVSVAAINVLDEPIAPAEDGSFSYVFSTKDVSGTILARFRATDHNGNTSAEDLTLYNDGVGPFAEITEPEDMSYYASVVRVSGRVLDASGAATTGEVKSVSYRVPGTSIAGPLYPAAGGSYSFEFATKDEHGAQVIDGSRTIEVTAVDWNLNSTTVAVMILRGSGNSDIPSFAVKPQSEQVEITWEPVLHATSYKLYTPRDGQVRENVTSPYVWDSLTNGELYSFHLQAVLPYPGADAWSDLQDAIPLSGRTLAPWVKDVGYRSITIEWRDTAAASEYVVERREGNGPWLVRTTTADTSLTETGLAHDTWYAYRVTRFRQEGVVSAEASGMPSRFGPGGAALAATYGIYGSAFGVAAAGDYAYLAHESAGLRIFDISDPFSPILIGTYDTAGHAYGVAVASNYAYVADYEAGLQVISISNPYAPTLVGTCDTPGSACAVAVAGDYAYVADQSSGLQIIDVSVPASPTLIPPGYPTSAAQGVAIAGDYAYLADEIAGLKIIDVSDPASPSLLGTYVPPTRTFGVTVAGDYAYVVDFNSGLLTVDVSVPSSPVLFGSPCDTPGYAYRVVLAGDHAYVADYYAGLAIIDVSHPGATKLLARYDTTCANDVAVAGGFAYLADTGSGLRVIDIGTPASPTPVGGCGTSGNAFGVTVAGDYAYVAATSGGLRVIDISNPSLPVAVGAYDTPVQAMGVVVSGEYAYVADDGGGLQIIEVSHPGSPVRVGNYNTPGLAYGVAVAGDFAYVADQVEGLQIIDISNPAAPALAASYSTAGLAWGVAVSGRYAYVAAYSGGLEIIDVSSPTSPAFVGSCETAGQAFGVAVAGDYAYVGTSSNLEIINVSDPASPTIRASPSTSSYAFGVTLAGSWAYVAESGAGVEIFDVSNPSAPRRVGGYDTPGNARAVAVAGFYAYVADQAAGLQIIRLGGD